MPRYRVWGKIVATKYLGEFEAETEAAAEELALESDAAHVTICHHCSDEIEEPEIMGCDAEEMEATNENPR